MVQECGDNSTINDTILRRAVDVWAIGCLFSEMLTGEPLFPGESDIDQLHLIMKCFGKEFLLVCCLYCHTLYRYSVIN